jgi:hypothetical protein
MRASFGPGLIFAALGIFIIIGGLPALRRGDFLHSRIPANRRTNPIAFWFFLLLFFAAGLFFVLMELVGRQT